MSLVKSADSPSVDLKSNSSVSVSPLTFVSVATLSWTCNQTSEDIPVGESSMTKEKQGQSGLSYKTQTSQTDMEPCAREEFHNLEGNHAWQIIK